MSWSSHPHRLEYPTAIAWRGDGAAVAVASAERVEVIELAAFGSRRLDARFEEVFGLSFEGGEVVVRDGEPEEPIHRVAGFDAAEIIDVARSRSGQSTLVATRDAGVQLVRGDQSPLWLADRGAIAFAGERPIVGSCVYSAGGDPRRALRACGGLLAPEATAANPEGQVAFACSGVVHVVGAADLIGVDPLPGLSSPATDLALTANHLAAVSDHEVVVFERGTGAVAARWHHTGHYQTRLAFLDDETLLLGADAIEVWRWRDRRRVDRWNVGDLDRVDVLRCARDRVMVAGNHHLALLSPSGEPSSTFDLDGQWIRDADVHPSRPWIAVVIDDQPGRVLGDDGAELAQLPETEHVAFTESRVWISDYDTGRSLSWPGVVEAGPSLDPFSLSARVDGGVLLGGDASLARYRDDATEVWSSVYRDGVSAVGGAIGSPVFYSAGRSPWIAERRLDDGTLARVLPAGTGAAISSLAISAGGDHLVAGDEAGRVAVWELGERCKRIGLADSSDLAVSERFEPGELGEIQAVAFGPELVALANGVLRWKGPLIGDIGRRDPDRVEIDGDCLSSDGLLVARTQWDQPIEICSVRSGEVLARVPEPEEIHGLNLAFSPASDRLLVADAHTVAVWSVNRGELVGRLDVDREITGAAFASDRQVIAWVDRHETAAGCPSLMVCWDPDTSELGRWPSGAIDPAVELGGADGLCAAGNRALVWSQQLSYLIDGDDLIAVLSPHQESVSAGALSASGIAATGDRDGVIRIWDRAGRLSTELCTTSDGSWWRSAPEFLWEPSSNLAEGRW